MCRFLPAWLILTLTLSSCGGSGASDTGETSATSGGAGGASAGGPSSQAGANHAGAPPSGGATSTTGETAGSAGAAGSSGNQGKSRFPTGVYHRCAQGLHTFDQGFLNVSGYQETATLTLTQSADSLGAVYVDQNGNEATFAFREINDRAASFEGNATTLGGFAGMCVLGPGNTPVYPASYAASSGTMTHDGSAVFLAFNGALRSDAGSCGTLSGNASLWIACDDGPSPTSAPPAAAAGTWPTDYTCVSQIETSYSSQGQKQFVAAGGDHGALELTWAGAELVAKYSGDPSVSGSVKLVATSTNTAVASAEQGFSLRCDVPVGAASDKPQTLPLSGASLVVDGTTLFLTFTGTMGDGTPCAGASKAGSLICQLATTHH